MPQCPVACDVFRFETRPKVFLKLCPATPLPTGAGCLSQGRHTLLPGLCGRELPLHGEQQISTWLHRVVWVHRTESTHTEPRKPNKLPQTLDKDYKI